MPQMFVPEHSEEKPQVFESWKKKCVEYPDKHLQLCYYVKLALQLITVG